MKHIPYPMFGGNAFDESAIEDYAKNGKNTQQKSDGQPVEQA